jgi:SAM-dependent methyltransferase
MRQLYADRIHFAYHPPEKVHEVPHRYDCIADSILMRRPAKDIRLLEVGAESPMGPSHLSNKLQVPPVNFEVADISERAVSLLRSEGWQAECVDISQQRTSYADGRFDVVVMSEVLEHLIDPDFAIIEAKRVLKPDGLLYITTPNLAAWFNRFLLFAGTQPLFTETSVEWTFGRSGFLPRSRPVGHLRLYTYRALKEFLDYHGLKVIELRGLPVEGAIVPIAPLAWLDATMSVFPKLAAGLFVVATPSHPLSSLSPSSSVQVTTVPPSTGTRSKRSEG